jgi:hypothetical protein
VIAVAGADVSVISQEEVGPRRASCGSGASDDGTVPERSWSTTKASFLPVIAAMLARLISAAMSGDLKAMKLALDTYAKAMLIDLGYEVVEAESAEQSLNRFDRDPLIETGLTSDALSVSFSSHFGGRAIAAGEVWMDKLRSSERRRMPGPLAPGTG